MADKSVYIPFLVVLLLGMLAAGTMLGDGITGLAIGRYKMEMTEHPPMLSLRPECVESDRGYDWYVPGKTWYESDSYNVKADSCLRAYMLHEYYCFNGRRMSRRVTCPLGYSCQDGACMTDDKAYYTVKQSSYQKRVAREQAAREAERLAG